MKISKELDRLESIRKEINQLYIEKQKIEKEIIPYMIENKDIFENYAHSDYTFQLLWLYDKYVDYDLMKEKYPEIYVLGLTRTFSKKVLFNSVDKATGEKILRECLVNNSRYKVKEKRIWRKKGDKLVNNKPKDSR